MIGGDVSGLHLGRPLKAGAEGHYGYTVWRGPDGHTVSVTTELADGGRPSPVEQARATSPYFKTAQRVGPGSSLSAVEAAFPGAAVPGHAPNTAYSGRMTLLDDSSEGIAFEFPVANGHLAPSARCAAVTIYSPGRTVFSGGLPLYTRRADGDIALTRLPK